MKQSPFVIVIALLVLGACNNESGQVATPSNASTNHKDEQMEPMTSPSNDLAISETEEREQDVPPSPDPIELPNSQTKPLVSPDTDNKIVGDPDKLQQKASESLLEETTIELNPAHGEPGHRCDVAVGAIMSAPTSVKICKENR